MPFSSHRESKLHPRQLKESIWSQNGRIPLVKIYHTFDMSSLTPYRCEEVFVVHFHDNNTHRSLCCEHGGSAMALFIDNYIILFLIFFFIIGCIEIRKISTRYCC